MNEGDLSLLSQPDRLKAYLASKGLVGSDEEVTITPLGGGVSNCIVRLTTAQGSTVIKQAQPKLQVKVDWFAPIDRVLIEARAMRALKPMLPPGTVPDVTFIDESRFLYGMEAAPESSVTWKSQLLQGWISLPIARRVGEILAAMHNGTSIDGEIRSAFQDRRILHALRIEPCFLYLTGIHPHLEQPILAQVDRLQTPGRCLVHGDYTPKNMLVFGDRIVLLDYEIAHWGNPCLDSGFAIAHLLLKAAYHPAWAARYVEACREFWEAYVGGIDFEDPSNLEQETAWVVPFLVLARLDSKSPVEYLADEKGRALTRGIAEEFILKAVDTLEPIYERFLEIAADGRAADPIEPGAIHAQNI